MWVPSLGRQDPRGKKQQLTPVLLAREFHGQRSLMGCSPWGGKELDTTAHRCVCAHTRTHTHTHGEAVKWENKGSNPDLSSRTKLYVLLHKHRHILSPQLASTFLADWGHAYHASFLKSLFISSLTSSQTNKKILNLYGLHRYSTSCAPGLLGGKTWQKKTYGFPKQSSPRTSLSSAIRSLNRNRVEAYF